VDVVASFCQGLAHLLADHFCATDHRMVGVGDVQNTQ
jgi:hypothetical protein